LLVFEASIAPKGALLQIWTQICLGCDRLWSRLENQQQQKLAQRELENTLLIVTS
jgi:hypothetical protein